ncbi:MAG TPA: L,D-transpeptidase family protein [Candidatus Binatia bacterium]|nr:L,D-transpeptidase family protein [Candidatus Binatia bacterium]
MSIARNLLLAAILCAIMLPAPVLAEPEPPWVRDDPYGESARESRRAGSASALDQLRLLEEALDRYRDIERRGGWKKLPTDLVMGPPYSYDCAHIEALEDRMAIEGFLVGRRARMPRFRSPVSGREIVVAPGADRRNPDSRLCKYGSELADAVRAFQVARKVKGDGQVGGLTYAQLNRPVSEIVQILEEDVARWRNVWLHPSGTFLLVNIPYFELYAYEDGREVLRMPVVTGQPSWQTPLFSDELEHIILNPDWGIPPSIAKDEIIPLGRRDPGYFKREGITGSGGSLRQRPGPRNPLGRIKFMMPNQNNVYLHDTPHKNAFDYPSRSFSHGCIRLGRPMDLAYHLLRDDPQWTPSRLDDAVASRKTQRINLARHMPVHIIYSTTWVNEDGHVSIRKDVYAKNRIRVREIQDDEPRPPRDELDVGP